eukprot:gene4302-8554_t
MSVLGIFPKTKYNNLFDLTSHIYTKSMDSVPNPQLTEVNLDGLIFIAKINKKNDFFLPSAYNYFGGVRVSKVLCDTGMDIGGGSPVLLVEEIRRVKFSVELCTDIIGHNCNNIHIDRVRFSLCSEDIKPIVETPAICVRLLPGKIEMLSNDLKTSPSCLHALLGQSILRMVSSFRFSSIEYFVIFIAI